MGKSYKNFWSLNIDEAIVAGILRGETVKGIDVLMPIDAQLKDVDLIVSNIKKRKFITVQVKGSRAFEPRKIEVKKFGQGSPGWFFIHRKTIFDSTADYFVFIIHVIEELSKIGRRRIMPHLITISTKQLKSLVKKYKREHGGQRYSFLIWVNPKIHKAFDFRDKRINLNRYLDKKGINKLYSKIK